MLTILHAMAHISIAALYEFPLNDAHERLIIVDDDRVDLLIAATVGYVIARFVHVAEQNIP